MSKDVKEGCLGNRTTASAKALRQKLAWQVLRTARVPVRIEQRAKRGMVAIDVNDASGTRILWISTG